MENLNQLDWKLSILRIEVEVETSKMKCSKNDNWTNIVAKAYKMKYLLIFKTSLGQKPLTVGQCPFYTLR